jgi:hypothetical protein
MLHDNSVKTEKWPKEKIDAHLKKIGADKPPEPRNQYESKITAPKQSRWGKYL